MFRQTEFQEVRERNDSAQLPDIVDDRNFINIVGGEDFDRFIERIVFQQSHGRCDHDVARPQELRDFDFRRSEIIQHRFRGCKLCDFTDYFGFHEILRQSRKHLKMEPRIVGGRQNENHDVDFRFSRNRKINCNKEAVDMFGTCMRHRETGTDYRRHPFFAEHHLFDDFLRIESRGVSCEEPCQFGDGFLCGFSFGAADDVAFRQEVVKVRVDLNIHSELFLVGFSNSSTVS